MFVYLVHHGDAVGPGVDPQRPLSSRGRTGCERLARECAGRGVKPSLVWHSGKLRARQTSEFFWRDCNPFADFGAIRGLRPEDPPDWVRDQLAGETRDVLLAGHMPNLASLLRLLVTGSADGALSFPPHGVVALESTNGRQFVECWRLEEPPQIAGSH
jgi:phosphohistidine phosphatase